MSGGNHRVIVHLDAELHARLVAEAARRRRDPEEVIVEAVDRLLTEGNGGDQSRHAAQ